jgi:methyl-accepting chemotaxis protein
MDLTAAMKAHAEWKMKFRNAIVRKEVLDVDTISVDTCCDLGKWLNGESRHTLGGLRSHADCLVKHAEFHRQAGRVAQTINAGNYSEAEAMLGSNTPYRTASQNVVVAIAALKTEGGL